MFVGPYNLSVDEEIIDKITVHFPFFYSTICSGLPEYLLDRNTESEKKGWEMKYDIIRTISQSSTCLQNFGDDLYLKFGAYVKQGVFYSESHVAVTYEQED